MFQWIISAMSVYLRIFCIFWYEISCITIKLYLDIYFTGIGYLQIR